LANTFVVFLNWRLSIRFSIAFGVAVAVSAK